jgi:hypothetical protein
MDLPCRVKATSTINEDGSYTIVINSKLNIEQQLEGYLHELHHIDNNDFYSEDVSEIEICNHKLDGVYCENA